MVGRGANTADVASAELLWASQRGALISNDHDSGDEKYNRISMRTKRDRSVCPPRMLAVRQEASRCNPLSRAKRKHEIASSFRKLVWVFFRWEKHHALPDRKPSRLRTLSRKRQGKDAMHAGDGAAVVEHPENRGGSLP